MAISITGGASGSGLEKLAPAKMASRVASKMMSELDTNQDGSVSKDEFVSGLTSNGVSADAAGKMFDVIDVHKAGVINKSDLETAIRSGAVKVPSQRPLSRVVKGTAANDTSGTSGTGNIQPVRNFAPADSNKDDSVSAQEAALYGLKHPANTAMDATDAAKIGQNVDELV